MRILRVLSLNSAQSAQCKIIQQLACVKEASSYTFLIQITKMFCAVRIAAQKRIVLPSSDIVYITQHSFWGRNLGSFNYS
jgi:hypothetical protein